MSVTSRHSKYNRSLSSPPKTASMNVFDEVLKRIDMIACTEIRTRAISYGMTFTGFYRDVGFEFNVYVKSQGLNRKNRQNPVWHNPVTPPDTSRDAIDEENRWVK